VLDEITALLDKDLSYERPAAEVAITVQKIETLLLSLEGWMKP